MGDNTDKTNTIIDIKGKVERMDDTLNYHKETLKKTETYLQRELQHLENKIKALFTKLLKAENHIDSIKDHDCFSKDRINDNHEETMEAHRSIKRLYIWQASIGISLLICFLTIGVAAVTYVTELSFNVKKNVEFIQKNTQAIDSLRKNLEERDKAETQELKQAVKDAFNEHDK